MAASNSVPANPFIEWPPHLTTDVTLLDSQHKELATILNEVTSDIYADQEQKVESDSFRKLINHTVAHFKTEELLMQKYDYHKKDHHARIHVMLISMIEYYLKQYSENPNISNADLVAFLEDWLIEHMKIDDKPFGEFLVSKGVS